MDKNLKLDALMKTIKDLRDYEEAHLAYDEIVSAIRILTGLSEDDSLEKLKEALSKLTKRPPLIDKEKEKKAREIEERLLIRGCKTKDEVLADAKRARDDFNKQQ
jgi:hypothetical protein